MSSNERFIGGSIQHRRFAYLHKNHRDRFGLLEAVDYQNARDHLGGDYHIRQIWLTLDDVYEESFDRDRRLEIVSSIFKSQTQGPPNARRQTI